MGQLPSSGDSAPSSSLSSPWARVPRKVEGLVTRTIADERVVVPIRGELARLQNLYVLTPVAEHIWEEIDGQRSLAELRDSIAETYDVPREAAGEDLAEFVSELASAGLIELIPSPGERAAS